MSGKERTNKYRKYAVPIAIACTLLVALGMVALLALLQYYFIPDPENVWFFRAALLIFVIILGVGVVKKSLTFLTHSESVEALRIREEEYRIAAQHSGKYILRYNVKTRTIYQQPEAAELLGLPVVVENVPDSLLKTGMVAPESTAEFAGFYERMHRGEDSGSTVVCLKNYTGEFAWYRGDYTLIYDANGEPLQGVVSFYDVTELREKELAFEKWQQSYEALPVNSINYYEYNLTNDTFDREEGSMLPPVPESVDRTLSAMALYTAENYAYPEDRQMFLEFYSRERLLASYYKGIRSEQMECRRLGPGGEPLWTKASVQLIPDPYSDGVKGFILLEDIDARKREELLVSAKSREDPLTGLLNRNSFVERINRLFADKNAPGPHAVVMIDIDGFKNVNDTFGHHFGDQVLMDIARDLKNLLRGEDLIGRIGGDEFIACLKSIPPEPEFLEKRTKYLCQVLVKHYGAAVAVSGSLGVALYPRDGTNFEELYQKADKALYRAKRLGKNQYVLYTPEMEDDVRDASIVEAPDTGAAAEADAVWLQDSGQDRTMLIVDDVAMNRDILAELFREEFAIFQAAGGREALELLETYGSSISVVLLDLIMPEVDGLDVIRKMQEDTFLNTIPVVVTSAAEETGMGMKAIELGASDFVSKPVDPRLVRVRVQNAINKRERENLRAQNRYLLVQKTEEELYQKKLRYLVEYDALTGIYNREAFAQRTKEMLSRDKSTTYVLARFDVDRLRVVNDIFGHEEGDKLICYVADWLKHYMEGRGTYGRIEGDNFALCMPYSEKTALALSDDCYAELRKYPLPIEILCSFGLYIIEEEDASVNLMLDRAGLAAHTIKESYVKRVAYYDKELRQALLAEQEIVSQMRAALAEEQFDIYLQPKCRLDSGEVVGAEALVRWFHPTKGMMLPKEFIPIFEKNGFIMQMDAYVWERVCRLLRDWIDRGIAATPITVSSNVSRANIYNPHLCRTLVEMAKKYDIPPGLLEMEITESAYVDNPKLLSDVVAELHSYGFTVQMDDFGSGYSSLNMLKDISVDVLKLDMQFLYGLDEDGRGSSILASVVSMAECLGLPVVAEGVETKEQAEFLLSIGCATAQGYHFYQPMSVEEFERLLQ